MISKVVNYYLDHESLPKYNRISTQKETINCVSVKDYLIILQQTKGYVARNINECVRHLEK